MHVAAMLDPDVGMGLVYLTWRVGIVTSEAAQLHTSDQELGTVISPFS